MTAVLPAELENLANLHRVGDSWMASCPVHKDSKPSLSLRVADDGKVLAHCHAGCDQTMVADALGLKRQESNSDGWTPHGQAIAIYDYRDEAGRLLYQVCRTADKQFPQRKPDPTAKSGWRWNLGDTRRVLFRLPQLLEGIAAGQSVCIPEGERDVLALVDAGKVATCNSGGAGKWRPEFAQVFRDVEVTVFADKDAPGRAHARTIAASLDGIASRVWVVEAADPHKDISAHLAAGLSLSDVLITHRPEERATVELAPTLISLLDRGMPDYDWIVPGLLERGERFMLTGAEGLGKSMMLRQLAVCMAAGIHPTLFTPMDPLEVLFIDCENNDRQTIRKFWSMVRQAAPRHGRPVGDNIRVLNPSNGVDLTHEADAAWLLERVTAHKPDVLFIGPLYRLHLGNPNDEETARRVTVAIDAARNANDCAMIIEAHAGHGESGQTRPLRPTGSSLYLRWPEFGYGLRKTKLDDENDDRVSLVSWRGPRDERDWPTRFRRSHSGWAWEPDVDS